MPDEPPQVATTPGSLIPKEPSAVAAPRMATAPVSMMAEELIPGVLKPQEARPDITMRRVGLQEARDKHSASCLAMTVNMPLTAIELTD